MREGNSTGVQCRTKKGGKACFVFLAVHSPSCPLQFPLHAFLIPTDDNKMNLKLYKESQKWEHIRQEWEDEMTTKKSNSLRENGDRRSGKRRGEFKRISVQIALEKLRLHDRPERTRGSQGRGGCKRDEKEKSISRGKAKQREKRSAY